MTGYVQVNIKDMISELGENRVKAILSNFYCPLNQDVEDFLKTKAIEFSKQDITRTYLIMASYRGEYVLAGYYAICNKFFLIDSNKALSSNMRKRIKKFAQFIPEMKKYQIVAPLIAQLGKNYQNGYNTLITGDELLEMACIKIREVQYDIGGKIAYLECEDKPKLIDFYESNGFVRFATRKLDMDEKDKLSGEYLIQMLKYFRD